MKERVWVAKGATLGKDCAIFAVNLESNYEMLAGEGHAASLRLD